jgi:hypothetical protein
MSAAATSAELAADADATAFKVLISQALISEEEMAPHNGPEDPIRKPRGWLVDPASTCGKKANRL